MQPIDSGIAHLKTATKIRLRISAIYRRYHALSKLVQTMSKDRIKHFDIKRAVDAIHYFGGGWPYANSKGRMEALLDAFAGMYKVLHATGNGEMVEDHLREKGIKVELTKAGQLHDMNLDRQTAEQLAKKYGLETPETLFELLTQVVMVCDDMQTDICQLADVVRDDLRPKVQEQLGIDDPEYRRLADVMKLKLGTEKAEARIDPRVKKTNASMTNFYVAAKEVKRVPRPSKS